jgi:membrane protease YdiL (CAAX protease family)
MGQSSAAAKWGALSGLLWGILAGVVLFTFIFTSEPLPQLPELGPALKPLLIASGGLLGGIVLAGIGAALGLFFSAVKNYLPTEPTWQKGAIFYLLLWAIFQLLIWHITNWLLAAVSLVFCLSWGSSFGFLYERSLNRPVTVLDISKYPTPKVVAYMLLLSVLLSGVGGLISLKLPVFPGFDPSVWLSEWMFVAAPILFLRRQRLNLRDALSLGRFRPQHALLGLATAIVFFPITLNVAYLTEQLLGPYPRSLQSVEFRWFPQTWPEMILWLGGTAVSAGIAEEILARGFMQNGLQRNWRPVIAVSVSGVVFGLLHGIPWRIPYAILFGLVAGYLFLRTNSLYTTISFHIASNTIAELLSFLKSPFSEATISPTPWIVITIISVLLTIFMLFASRSRYVGRNPTTPLTRPSRYCAYCGSPTLPSARFCVECGESVPPPQ